MELVPLLKRIKFTRYNANTIANANDFRRELADVRAKGYSRDRGEAYNGIYCIGTPPLDRNGYPVAAIWTTGPSDDVNPKNIPKIGDAFREAAISISRRLGHSG